MLIEIDVYVKFWEQQKYREEITKGEGSVELIGVIKHKKVLN